MQFLPGPIEVGARPQLEARQREYLVRLPARLPPVGLEQRGQPLRIQPASSRAAAVQKGLAREGSESSIHPSVQGDSETTLSPPQDRVRQEVPRTLPEDPFRDSLAHFHGEREPGGKLA